MSEPTLYRLATREEYDTWADGIMEIFAMPVERCEHGNIDKHFVKNPYSTITGEWCEGAGIGGNDV